jgi:hypothetical protein
MLWDPPVVQQQYRNTDGQTLTELSEFSYRVKRRENHGRPAAMDIDGNQIASSALTAVFCIQEKSLCTYPLKPSHPHMAQALPNTKSYVQSVLCELEHGNSL